MNHWNLEVSKMLAKQFPTHKILCFSYSKFGYSQSARSDLSLTRIFESTSCPYSWLRVDKGWIINNNPKIRSNGGDRWWNLSCDLSSFFLYKVHFLNYIELCGKNKLGREKTLTLFITCRLYRIHKKGPGAP